MAGLDYIKADGSTAFETAEKAVNDLFAVTGDANFRNEALVGLYTRKRWLKHLFKASVGAVKMMPYASGESFHIRDLQLFINKQV